MKSENLCTAFAWCVCDPDGDVFVDSIRKEPSQSVEFFMSKYDVSAPDWKKLKKAGYRCRKFRILEVEEPAI